MPILLGVIRHTKESFYSFSLFIVGNMGKCIFADHTILDVETHHI